MMPSRRIRTIGLIVALFTMMLTAIGTTLREDLWKALSVNMLMKREEENTILTPCSRFTESYLQLHFTDGNFAQWPSEYHQTAAAVVEEHLRSLSRAPQCAAETGNGVLPAGPKLTQLAGKLPSWKNASVSQWEMGSVLLEFLRAYECALVERLYFLYPDALNELESKLEEEGQPLEITLSLLAAEAADEDRTIMQELATARPTLHRSLAVLAGLDRLLPLNNELQCIERASLDIRNALALSAEAGACLPRIWNAKDPLRDLPQ